MPIDIARYIDHTLLKQTTRITDIDRICLEASYEHFAAVCIPPKYVHEAKKILDSSEVRVATVIAFPLGYATKEIKVEEIKAALASGADEVDMVIDICALKSGNWRQLEDEIKACLVPVITQDKVIKVIVESGLLTDGELIACCELYGKYKIDYMKTSTGFAEKGATVEAVKLMRKHLPEHMGIKAAGGIRTYQFAKDLVDAGATRLGCSASMDIMKEARLMNSE